MKFTHLIVGLGNPEGKYFQTYHNIGFLTAETLASTVAENPAAESAALFKKKGNQMLCEIKAGNAGALILKPLTYMNLSGQAVVAVCRKHKIDTKNVIVFADDLYIEKGHIRISFGGSGGGHNGLKSITELLGTNQYARIRIGIAPENPQHSMANYVLSRIGNEDKPLIDSAIKSAAAAAQDFINGMPFDKLQSKYNSKNTANNSQSQTQNSKPAAVKKDD